MPALIRKRRPDSVKEKEFQYARPEDCSNEKVFIPQYFISSRTDFYLDFPQTVLYLKMLGLYAQAYLDTTTTSYHKKTQNNNSIVTSHNISLICDAIDLQRKHNVTLFNRYDVTVFGKYF